MSNMGYEFKIGAVLRKYGFEVYTNGRPSKCPFCGHKHLYIDDKAGVFTCFYNGCNKTGGVKDFALAFYGEVLGQSVNSAKEAMDLLDEDLGENIKKWIPQNAYLESNILNPIAPVEHRNIVYKKMTEILPLKEVDENSLLERGYTKEQIKSFGYCSLPVSEQDRIITARKLLEAGISLKNVGGFEMVDGVYKVADFGFYRRKRAFGYATASDMDFVCFLVPSYDIHGNLQFFQIAWDKRLTTRNEDEERKGINYGKYTVFSTPKRPGGGKIKADAGYVGYYKKNENGIIVPDLRGKTSIPVIEGPLKTALYFELIGRKEPCIAQVGVQNYKALKKALIEMKNFCPELVQIDDCYDMDKFTKENVALGSENLKKVCEELGFRYHMRKWDSNYKGIDDYAFAWTRKNN